MLIILDKTTNKILQTLSINYGIQLAENQAIQEVSDDFMNKYNTAHTYDLVFADGLATDITVTQTIIDYEASLPIEVPPPTDNERLLAIEQVISMLI